MDHDTKAGFEAIAQAREYLLKLGRKEIEDPEKETLSVRGSHAVAPVRVIILTPNMCIPTHRPPIVLP